MQAEGAEAEVYCVAELGMLASHPPCNSFGLGSNNVRQDATEQQPQAPLPEADEISSRKETPNSKGLMRKAYSVRGGQMKISSMVSKI